MPLLWQKYRDKVRGAGMLPTQSRRLTWRLKLIFVLARLENTALYFVAGYVIGRVVPGIFWLVVLFSFLIGGAIELLWPRFWVIARFDDDVTEDDVFVDLLTNVYPISFLYFCVGFIIARLGL